MRRILKYKQKKASSHPRGLVLITKQTSSLITTKFLNLKARIKRFLIVAQQIPRLAKYPKRKLSSIKKPMIRLILVEELR
jgi:hypothetical protein